MGLIVVIIAIIAILIIVWFARPKPETFLVAPTAQPTIIPSIPLSETAPVPTEIGDPTVRAVPADGADPVVVTLDAQIARYGIAHARDKRVFDAIAKRTARYWEPIFKEELDRNDTREWWDDIAYPINDSGELVPHLETDDMLTAYDSFARIPPL
jgi:hypothetical protein